MNLRILLFLLIFVLKFDYLFNIIDKAGSSDNTAFESNRFHFGSFSLQKFKDNWNTAPVITLFANGVIAQVINNKRYQKALKTHLEA